MSDPGKSEPAWHALDPEAVFAALKTGEDGLSEAEASRRLGAYGPNRLPESSRRGLVARLAAQFHNALIYVLMAAALLTAYLGHWVDALVIAAVVVVNALIGFAQEGKAEDALRAIRRMLSPRALVLRNGRRKVLPAEQLVPGDVVLLQPGDRVPADLRLFVVKGLQIQESVLTGESVATDKQVEPVAEDVAMGDRSSMAWSGTLVTHGQGMGVVVATGAATEIGRISVMVSDLDSITTPLLRQLEQFGRILTVVILAVAVVTFCFGLWLRGYTAAEMFMVSVGLAVAAIPEGLPAIMTITLAIGVQRMARRNAIIRRLPAVETLGAVSVICSDKTGTLTRNEMVVRSLLGESSFEFSGTGYDPHGAVFREGEEITPSDVPWLQEVLRAGLLCNDAELESKDGEWRVHGDPMEGALLVAAMKAGLDVGFERRRYPRTDLIPFESEHRFMATLHHGHEGEAFIVVKGAPERVLAMCDCEWQESGAVPLRKDLWLRRIDALAAEGQRVIALARKAAATDKVELFFGDVENGLTLLALVGMIDPPRKEAVVAVRRCQQAGIRVKMITGDHAATARAIAAQLHLENADEALLGAELEKLSDEQLRQRVETVDVYARVAPEHKLRLVKNLQELGHVVAMTGDGVNDAPALKRADVGIAMGCTGTEAAKEASEMVLADDNFASIAHAVEEGRTVYDNIRKAILFILPTNGGEALIILGAILLGFHQLPMTPVQILWVNMITAVTLALVLAFEAPEPGVMRRPPRVVDEPLLSPYLIWRIALVSLVLMAGTFWLFLRVLESGASIEQARTAAVNVLVMFEVFYLLGVRHLHEPAFNHSGLPGNRWLPVAVAVLLLFQLAFTYLGPLQDLFGTEAISPGLWLEIVLIGFLVLPLVELEKAWMRRRRA